VGRHLRGVGTGQPILSVDGKKKELIGNFKNPGAVWCLRPEEVNVYDFLKDAEGVVARRVQFRHSLTSPSGYATL
jgi:hypothetical protein